MNTSAKGRRREHASRDLYLARGWMVNRAAASKGIDLVATFPEHSVAHYLSVKSGTWPPAGEIRALRTLARRCALGGPTWAVIVHRKDDRAPLRARRIMPEPADDCEAPPQFFARRPR